MDNLVDLPSGLSSDYGKLYESSKYMDISIRVGREPHNKIFRAHSLVLCTRSKYLEKCLTGNTETTDGIQQIVMTFEDETPDVFEILLR